MRVSRRKQGGRQRWAMASLAGAGAALTLLSTPVGLLEMIVSSVGLSEILAAAAPPLGLKARALMAVFIGLMTFALVVILSRDTNRALALRHENGRATRAAGGSIMGFALSKLTALARGRTGPVKSPIRAVVSAPEEQAAPALRRADAHPDAPPRPPIFASRDFGGLDIFPQPERRRDRQDTGPEVLDDMVQDPPGLPMSTTPAHPSSALRGPFDAVPDAGLDIGAAALPPLSEPVIQPSAEDVSPAVARATSVGERTQALSLTELTDRLERGLLARNAARQVEVPPAAPSTGDGEGSAPVLATLPPAQAVPVRASVADEVDGALRAALGTLRGITGRAR